MNTKHLKGQTAFAFKSELPDDVTYSQASFILTINLILDIWSFFDMRHKSRL